MNGKDNFLLDTNVILGFLNGNAKINAFFEKALPNAELHISQITRMELLGYPSITIQEEKSLKAFLSYTKTISISDAICDQAILLRQATKLKLPDALIAATAVTCNFILVTCDSDLLNKSAHFHSVNPIAT